MRRNRRGTDGRSWSDWRREWPERAAWTASAAGLVGLLLVSLLVAVELWAPDSRVPRADAAPVVVRAEPSRTRR